MVLASAIYPNMGVRTKSGTTVITPEEWEKHYGYYKFFGITPTAITKAQELEYLKRDITSSSKEIKHNFERRYENAWVNSIRAGQKGDKKTQQEYLDEMARIFDEVMRYNHNADYEDYVKFNLKNIRKRVMMALSGSSYADGTAKQARSKIFELSQGAYK
jgi:hypothetical protein